MLESLQPAPPDPILGLNEAFRADNAPHKINLSVGVFRDEHGITPVLNCVKAAEQKLLASEATKSYLGIDGLPEFRDAALQMLGAAGGDAAAIQTPGGTGALRVVADFLATRFPGARIWISKPTWANHRNIFEQAGLGVDVYRYLDPNGVELDRAGMLEDLSGARSGDIVCLHACCHNPTGVDLTAEQWLELADVISARNLTPLIDCAYQGFGDGLQEDLSGIRAMFALQPKRDVLVCHSFSKSFSLYSERVGAIVVRAAESSGLAAAVSHLKATVRANYSNPPRHGAAIVATIWNDPELRSLWESELAAMRTRIRAMRTLLVERLKATGIERDFDFIQRQQGMFSFSGLNPMQVDRLRSEHSIYIVGSGRINVAGVTPANVERLAEAISAVLR